jgi:hypothetical protein
MWGVLDWEGGKGLEPKFKTDKGELGQGLVKKVEAR